MSCRSWSRPDILAPARLSTPELRIAEARWQLKQVTVTVALATAGLTPERWMKEVVK